MTIPREDHPGAKAALRARLRSARRALGPDERAAVADGLAAVALGRLHPGPAAGVVALYDSRPSEPGTRALRAGLAARGLVVVLPVVVGAGAPLAWVVDPGVDDGGTDGCLSAPAWPGGLAAVDVVLLPALAVDRSGTRLGQGGGHYDRTLALLPPRTLAGTALSGGSAVRGRPLLVAVVRDEELLPAGSLPREAHDVVVDAALTPTGWHDLG